MSETYRSDYLEIYFRSELSRAEKAALKNPDTSIHTVRIKICGYNVDRNPAIPSVLDFLETNKNTQCIQINDDSSCPYSFKMVQQLVAAASKNPKTDAQTLSIKVDLGSKADACNLCDILTSVPTKVTGLLLGQSYDFHTISTGTGPLLVETDYAYSRNLLAELTSAMMGLRFLRTLKLPGLSCSVILNAMEGGKFPFLQSLACGGYYWGATDKLEAENLERTMTSLASFLRSEAAPSLRKVELSGLTTISSDFTWGNLSDKTLETLGIHVEDGVGAYPAAVASLVTTPSNKGWTLDVEVSRSYRKKDQFLQALSSKLSKLRYNLCDDDHCTSTFLKELLRKTPSLRCLDIVFDVLDLDHPNAWIHTFSEGLACNKTLTSLYLRVDSHSIHEQGLGASSFDPLLEAIANSSTPLEKLYLHYVGLTQPSLSSLAHMLRNPSCSLKLLKVKEDRIEDEQALMLLSAASGCKALQSLSLSRRRGDYWSLVTWLAIASSIPDLALTSVSLNDCRWFIHGGGEGTCIQNALLKGLELNSQLESACFNDINTKDERQLLCKKDDMSRVE